MTPAPTPNKTEKKASPLAIPLAYIQRQWHLLSIVARWMCLMLTKDNLRAYLRRHWRLLALLILYIFFRPIFEEKLASLLQFFDPSWGSAIVWLGVIVILIALVCTHSLGYEWYLFSQKYSKSFVAILFGLWTYYHFGGAKNSRVIEPYIPCIYYMDIFLVVCACLLIVRVRSYREERARQRALKVRMRQATINGVKEGYQVDQPIRSEDEDLLGRRGEAKSLSEKIFKTDTSKGAFTLGLTAPWGAGKTSFMLVMREYLTKKPSQEVIVMAFNPWMYRKAPNLTQVFFEELSRTLAPYNSDLASAFIRYVRSLLAQESNAWLQLVARLLPQESNEKSITEQYDSLSQEICRLGRKIFIFIDDVDRLDREELVELFVLVRNSSSFPCMSYILAYDKEYVASQLKGCFDQHTHRYLEKIVQVEYALAQITPEQLEQALEMMLEKLEPDYPHLKAEIQSSGIKFEYHLPTLRAVSRLYNLLLSIPRGLKERVSHFDWFIIELIRIQYPLLFGYLRENYVSAFFVNINSQVVMQIGEEGSEDLELYNTTRETVVDFEQYLHENKKELGIDSPYHILELMKKLWGRSREKLIPQANDWGCIGRYFYRTMREGEFDIAEFRQYLSLPLVDGQQHPMKKIIPYLDRICNSSSKDRFIKLIHEIDLRPEEALNMLYIYFYIQSRDEVQRVSAWESNKWINTIREQERGRERKILEDLFSYPDIRKGVFLYVCAVIDLLEQIPIPFTREELEGIKEKLFLEYTQDATSIDPIACYRLWLHCQTYRREKIPGGAIRTIDLEKRSHGMNKRMKEIIEKNIEQLIPYLIHSPLVEAPSNEPKHYKPYSPYPIWTLDQEEINTEISGFEQFISGLNATSSPVIEEFQRFLKKWLGYMDVLGMYLDGSGKRDLYKDLSEHDQYWAQQWQRNGSEYYRGLRQDKRLFFMMLRYRGADEFCFMPFDFKVIQPKNIWDVSTSTEDCAIEL